MNSMDESCRAASSFDAAFEIVRNGALPTGIERVMCGKAGRRVLAAPVVARIDAPRHRVAAMDGYAIRQDDIDAGVVNYRLEGSSFAGDRSVASIAPGGAVYVATGAGVPREAACVVPHEQVVADRAVAHLRGRLPDKSHIRERGSDFAIGEIVVPAGRTIEPQTLVAIAAADVGDVEVWRRPRVSVITTGDELVVAGRAAQTERSVPDSLGEALLLLARQWGAVPLDASHSADDPAAIRVSAQAALGQADVVLVVGGASRGRHDFSKIALASLGLDLKFDTVAMKPGGPVWYGRIGAVHVVGLPGNPTAAMTVARLIVVPLLARLGGRDAASGLRWQDMATAEPIAANGPREAFLCGARTAQGVRLIERQTASSQMMLAQADVLIRRVPHAPALDAGALVQMLRF